MRTATRWWAGVTLPVRATIAASAASAIGLVLAAAGLVASLWSSLLHRLDEVSADRAHQVGTALAQGRLGPGLVPGDDSHVVQVLDPAGSVWAGSAELTGAAPLAVPGTGPWPDVRVGEEVYRLVSDTAVLPSETTMTVLVGAPLGDVTETVAGLTGALAVGLPVLLVVLAVIVHAVVRHTLGVVERMRNQLEDVTSLDSARRVSVPPATDAVRALALTMNAMLDRLAGAASGQRRFVADAAHELRTPLSTLRAQLDLPPESAEGSRAQLRAEADRLARLVDDLLSLARLDETARPRTALTLDLDEIVFDEVSRARPVSPVPIRTRGVGAAAIRGDPVLLRQVVRNLLDNAARYARSTVDVSLFCGTDGVVLVVADDGPGIPAPDRERVFDRFTRLDPARGHDAGGSVLGLAIVAEAVAAHFGRVTVDDNRPGARVTIGLPGTGPHGGPLDARRPGGLPLDDRFQGGAGTAWCPVNLVEGAQDQRC